MYWRLLVVWLMSQLLGFALPALPSVTKPEMPPVLACEQSQAGNYGYDAGFQSGLSYDPELTSAVTVRGVGESRISTEATSGYDGIRASFAANAARLRSQLTAEEIAGGHAFDKHVIQQGQFPGVTTRPQFATEIENVINNASEVRPLSNGRTAYWDSSSGMVVIRNPGAVDGGTAFKPTQGKTYFDNLK